MANGSGMFKPSTNTSGLGRKKQEDGQFVNPPAYPQTGGLTGSTKIGGKNSMSLQKSPRAKEGKV